MSRSISADLVTMDTGWRVSARIASSWQVRPRCRSMGYCNN